jgi:hypothetical protein
VVDPLADCPAWIRVGERGWSGELPMLPWSAGEDFELSLGGERLHVQLSPRSLEQRALTGTLWGERLLARVVGYGSPVVTLTRARVTVRGQGHAWTGLYLRRDTD